MGLRVPRIGKAARRQGYSGGGWSGYKRRVGLFANDGHFLPEHYKFKDYSKNIPKPREAPNTAAAEF